MLESETNLGYRVRLHLKNKNPNQPINLQPKKTSSKKIHKEDG